MDKTETYIKMSDCPEIQARSPHVHFNYFAGPKSHTIYYGGIDVIETNYIWLPRQDDLQKMVGKYPVVFEKFVNEVGINDFNYGLEEMFEWGLFEEYSNSTSMEQLWLAFVMKELYQKQWDGTEWKEIKE